jgi:hypothetical protein
MWSRLSDVSWCRKAIRTHFIHSGHSKKRFGRFRRSDILSIRMGLANHSKPSGRINKRRCLILFSYVSICRKAILTHFLYPGYLKKRLWQARLSDVLTRRTGQLIICLLKVLKNYVGEIDEAMFQGVERPHEYIFWNLSIEKKRIGWSLTQFLNGWMTL